MLPYFVIVSIIIGVFLYVFSTAKAARAVAVVAQAVLTGFAGYLFFLAKDGDIVTHIGDYEGFLGMTLIADTTSSVFVALTAFLFMIAAIYCFNDDFSKLFWFLMFVWQGLIIGIFLTRDLFNIFVLMEVATVVISILIMYKRDNRSMYDGMFYLMTGIIAMQFYLFGVGYVYKVTGVLDIDAAAAIFAELPKSSQILPFALMMTGIALKCAILPLFSWLPKAHGTPSAPPAVSALLSGIYIKCGVYMLMRIQPMFAAIDASAFFLVFGIITGIAGFILAMSQSDIKLILAYHTVSQVGLIVTGLSIGYNYSYIGGLYHAINHALFKSTLFLSAGVIIKAYGTRSVYDIHGVFRRFPLVGVATILAILGITGAPLMNGSISKYFIMFGTTWYISALLILMNLGTIISFIKYSSVLFGHPEGEVSGEPGEGVSVGKQAAILILGTLCFLGGIFGREFIYFLFNVRLNVDPAGYLEKSAIFIASLFGGYLIFRYYVKKSVLLKRIREIDLGFRETCISLGGFFGVALLVASFL
ncbi:MAG: proton-conducting membrane transporter [Oscillospiraceae bacterium]|nr:proton-conducting membrane transporter [Oscillospiraceae bacterium]